MKRSPGPGTAPAFLFPWKPARGRAPLLWAAAFATVVLHASFFYVFQTGPGAPSGQIPPAHRISMIVPRDPAGQSFLRSLDDYASVYASSLENPAVDMRELLETAGALEFQPGNAGSRLRLLPYEEPPNPLALQLPYAGREPVLPPPPPGDPGPAPLPAEDPSFPRLRVSGELTGRRILERPVRERPGNPLGLTPPATFRVAVDRSGRVLFAFPWEGAGAGFAPDVQTIRFSPDPEGPELSWGWVRLSW
ncbi:MAG TPA: hypothetical protein VMN36_14865 [Verrucomicrobiales bacterium]|nr:hypothetical protein [Verrucomicrobiales bacterium]